MKIWLCGLMADGTIDASLDAIANGADPRNVYVDKRLKFINSIAE